MEKKYLYVLVLSLFLIYGCARDLESTLPPMVDVIEFSATYPLQTRVVASSFEDGDRMGVYVSLSEDEKEIASNVRYQFVANEDRWIGDNSLYWPSRNRSIDVVGYYPYVDNLANKSKYQFAVKNNQEKFDDYESSDLLWARSENLKKENGTILLNYSHLMAGLTVNLVCGSGFDEEYWTNAAKQVFIHNASDECIVDLDSGTISGETGFADIVPLKVGDSFRTVVVPSSYPSGTVIFSILIDGREYQYRRSDDIILSSGKMHTFTIVVDKRNESGEFEFSVSCESIVPWLEDADEHDGIVKQYVNVKVDMPGTFAETLMRMGLDYRTIEALKVQGRVDESDIMFMGDMPSLTGINMKEMIIDSVWDGGDDVIPNMAFYGSSLVSLVLPDHLKRIGVSAFGLCPLNGTIIFPEGLETIDSGAFSGQSFSTNKIHPIFPSTLKRINGSAFNMMAKGEIQFPEGLLSIGSEAFCCSDLSGNLIFPSSLVELGQSQCINGSFSGDLEIPGGVKVIPYRCFSGASFRGSLFLSEGLEEVCGYAFSGCGFKGELVIPSTVKYIGDNAFQFCNFTSVVLPEDLTLIGREAFINCTRLSGSIIIPEGISVLSTGAFKDCHGITSVTLPKNLEMVGAEAFADDINIREIICESIEPPFLGNDVFKNLVKGNVIVQVPIESLSKYKNDRRWREFPRIVAYRSFECRPSKSCALMNGHQLLTLNSNAAWTLEHRPDWVSVYPESGTGKTAISLQYDDCGYGVERKDSLVFRQTGSDAVTVCNLSQYGYDHCEDDVVCLQTHTRGNGINIYFVGDGWDAASIANGSYIGQCRKDMEYFFGLPPYDRLREYFDVYSIVALSQECGVSSVSVSRDTRFNVHASRGQLYLDDEALFEYLFSVTGRRRGSWLFDGDLWRDVIVVIPNTDEYSGVTYYHDDGSAFSICPPTSSAYPNDARGIVQHEAGGCNFGKLAYEGVDRNAFATEASFDEIEVLQYLYGYYGNISLSGKPNNVTWSELIFDPRYSDYVDVYEGAYGYTRLIWRSESASCMGKSYIPYYNAISRYEITRRVMQLSGEDFSPERDFYSVDTNEWGSIDY